jgi:hypothetical protein
MKKVIEFDFSNIISYREYTDCIIKLKKWYDSEYKKLLLLYNNLLEEKNYNDSFSIIKKHNDLITELIKKIVSNLNINNLKIGIYLSNSFARETNLLDSDIDLNFMYEDKDYYVYEELISSILYKVVGKYRDFVHDSISHRLVTINNSYDKIIYNLKFKRKTICCEITHGNEDLMYKLFNTKKDLNSFIKYYTERLNGDNIDEWIYYQKEIYNGNGYLDYLFSYIKLFEEKTITYRFLNYKKLLIKNINSELNIINKLNINDIAVMKKYYKNHIFKYIYESLILYSKCNNIYDFLSVEERLKLISDLELRDDIYKYYSLIMTFNYLCDLYGIEFRIRYSNNISDDFRKFCFDKYGEDIFSLIFNLANKIYNGLLKNIKCLKVEKDNYKYDCKYEHINITNYSPLAHINNVSNCYKERCFLLPFVDINNKVIPIHPDTLDDFNISRERVLYYKLVYPTSSTRTVYVVEDNIFYKLPVFRQITRSIRDCKNKELKRSEIASLELNNYKYEGFYYLREECIYNEDERYNYIIREVPNKKTYPLFYLIVSNLFSKDKMLELIYKLVDIWCFYASKGIYFESFHTQNILVSTNLDVYYRDLSDIRILKYDIMKPSYIDELKDISELHSIFFDRSVISQNIEHFIKYREDITDNDINNIRDSIIKCISKYNLEFPDYSMNYDKSREGHHPIKVEKTRLR